MATDGVIEELICGLTTEIDRHYVKRPFMLECGHYVCKCCLLNQANIEESSNNNFYHPAGRYYGEKCLTCNCEIDAANIKFVEDVNEKIEKNLVILTEQVRNDTKIKIENAEGIKLK